ncbi:MAG: ATPase, T2SS/T4P/T4SS family [Bacteriovoracaceae bacterium]
MAGYVISIVGGKGGVGKSQLAANFAFSYAIDTKKKSLLLDFDQKASGDQDFITGIKPKKTVKELSEFSGVVDPRSVATFAQTHSSGVSYIGMPSDPTKSSTINPENLGVFLKGVTKIYPLTIIDCGSELNDLALKAMEYSTMIMLVTTPDILAMNQTKRLYAELVSLMFPKEMLHVVLNQYVKGHPVTPEVVSKTIGKPVLSVVPKDEQTCVQALSAKKPAVLAQKNSAFAKGASEVIRKILQNNILKTLANINKPENVGARSSRDDDSKGKSAWTALKSRVHKQLVETMDLKEDNDNDPKALVILKEKTRKQVVDILGKEEIKGIINSRDEMQRLVKEILDEALGLGPLEDLLARKDVSEIMVVGPDKIYYEMGGNLKKSEITFTSDRQVLHVIERIVAPIGRRIDEKTPYVDARLSDGSRVHAVIPPVALDGCTITIRKFPEDRLGWKDLVKFGSLTQNMADFLRIAVEGHRNILVSGGTGSGKTTLVNILGSFIQADERIITCEDSAELNFPQDHVVRLETRPPTLEGDGEIDIRCLVKQTLRMRPDRIVVGECRGGETLDMLQAMGTGHDGSMTTVHSNNPRECIGRVETLVQYAGAGLSPKAIREMIANAIHLIIQASRLDDGSRRITYITEVGGMQGDVVTLQDIFLYMQRDIDKHGKIIGEHQASGFIPKFIETLERKGYNIPRGLFSNSPGGGPPRPRPSGEKPNRPPAPRPGQAPQKKRNPNDLKKKKTG